MPQVLLPTKKPGMIVGRRREGEKPYWVATSPKQNKEDFNVVTTHGKDINRDNVNVVDDADKKQIKEGDYSPSPLLTSTTASASPTTATMIPQTAPRLTQQRRRRRKQNNDVHRKRYKPSILEEINSRSRTSLLALSSPAVSSLLCEQSTPENENRGQEGESSRHGSIPGIAAKAKTAIRKKKTLEKATMQRKAGNTTPPAGKAELQRDTPRPEGYAVRFSKPLVTPPMSILKSCQGQTIMKAASKFSKKNVEIDDVVATKRQKLSTLSPNVNTVSSSESTTTPPAANASFESPKGNQKGAALISEWSRKEDREELSVTIPQGSEQDVATNIPLPGDAVVPSSIIDEPRTTKASASLPGDKNNHVDTATYEKEDPSLIAAGVGNVKEKKTTGPCSEYKEVPSSGAAKTASSTIVIDASSDVGKSKIEEESKKDAELRILRSQCESLRNVKKELEHDVTAKNTRIEELELQLRQQEYVQRLEKLCEQQQQVLDRGKQALDRIVESNKDNSFQECRSKEISALQKCIRSKESEVKDSKTKMEKQEKTFCKRLQGKEKECEDLLRRIHIYEAAQASASDNCTGSSTSIQLGSPEDRSFTQNPLILDSSKSVSHIKLVVQSKAEEYVKEIKDLRENNLGHLKTIHEQKQEIKKLKSSIRSSVSTEAYKRSYGRSNKKSPSSRRSNNTPQNEHISDSDLASSTEQQLRRPSRHENAESSLIAATTAQKRKRQNDSYEQEGLEERSSKKKRNGNTNRGSRERRSSLSNKSCTRGSNFLQQLDSLAGLPATSKAASSSVAAERRKKQD